MAKQKAKRVRVGVAGLGRSGWGIHIRLLRPLKQMYEIVAVFDKDEARRKEAADEFGCATYTSYEQLIRDKNVELVVVAMPNQLHAKCAMDAMKAGKQVVCEKPLATNLKDADRMIACAKKCRRVLSVFQNRRYNADFLAVQKVIKSGVLGRIVQIRMGVWGFSRRWDWQTLKRLGGGLLNNHGPHYLDQALELFGPGMPKVFCTRDKVLTLGDADDHAKVILYGKGRPTVEVEVTAACAYPQEPWLVMGSKGSLAGNSKELRWVSIDPKKLPKRVVETAPTPDRSYNHEKYDFKNGAWSAEKDKSPGEVGFYLDLYKTLRENKKLVVTPEQVRRQMWVLEQCRKMAPV
jgi:scyllo-inositol 2-dehydrogenase (NADP+)